MQRYCLMTIPFHIQKIIKLRNLVRCSPSRRLSQQPFTGGIVHVFTISLCAPLPDEAAEAPRVREFVKVTQQVGKRGGFLSGTLTPSLSARQCCTVPWRSTARVDVAVQTLTELFTVSQVVFWARPGLRMS